jgi:hypothetical protein
MPHDPIQKITKTQMAGSVAQVVQCLPSKYEALSSKPQYPKKPPKNTVEQKEI